MRRKARVAVITGSRSEFGLLVPVLEAMGRERTLRAEVWVTGIHLLARFGRTVADVRASGFPIAREIPMYRSRGSDDPAGQVEGLARGIKGLSRAFGEFPPDWVLVLGDRLEALAAVLAASPRGIAVAHIHGGDASDSGHLDESVRHAITRFANLHFAATERSARRLRVSGEEPWRIHVVGAPGIDILKKRMAGRRDHPSLAALGKRYGLDISPGDGRRVALLIFHPHTRGWRTSGAQARALVAGVRAAGVRCLAVYPNGDPGSGAIIRVLEGVRDPGSFVVVPNLPRGDFVAWMARADLMIGNSSSGIIEAPSLGLPVVNVGPRNRGREHGANVIFVDTRPRAITRGIARALGATFRRRARTAPNPYGMGDAGRKIARIIASTARGERLLRKRLVI